MYEIWVTLAPENVVAAAERSGGKWSAWKLPRRRACLFVETLLALPALIAGLQRGKCIANLLCGGIMPSREVIRPYDCNKWHARRAKQSQLVGAQVDVGKSLAANRGSKSKLSPRMDGEQKKS